MAEKGLEPSKAVGVTGRQIASIVSAQAGGIADIAFRVAFANSIGSFRDVIEDRMDRVTSLCDTVSEFADKEDLDNVYNNMASRLIHDTKDLLEDWRMGIGLGVGTAYMGLDESYRLTPQVLSLLKNTQLDVAVKGPIERYWLSEYMPNRPDVKTAFAMLMEGLISRKEFNLYCTYEGWAPKWHDKLYDMMDRDPDIYTAFNMYKRGLIKDKEMLSCFKIAGYDESYHEALYEVLHRKPSFRELINLADFTPLTDSWITEVLRAQGYLDTDIQYILPAIKLRPLREEVRSVLGRYLWEFQQGRLTETQLKANMAKLGVLPKEQELNLLWAQLRYAGQLVDDQTYIVEERVDKNDPELVKATKEETIEAIKEELMTLGYNETRANLLAELWWWEYQVT